MWRRRKRNKIGRYAIRVTPLPFCELFTLIQLIFLAVCTCANDFLYRGRFTLVRNVKPKEGKKIKRVAKIIPYNPNKAEEGLREYEMLKVRTVINF